MNFRVLAIIVLLSGCAEASQPLASPSSTTAAEAQPRDEYGSISGLVVDDEQSPIAGAEVAIIAVDNITKTDEAGRFTFNDLLPGTYAVTAQRLGYGAGGRKVDVVAGEVTNTTIALAPFSTVESFIHAFPINSYIKFGESFVDIATHEGGNANTFCERCHIYFTIPPRPQDAVLEVVWTAGTHVPPALNDDIFFLICRDFQNGTAAAYRCGGNGSSGTSMASAYLKNGAAYALSGFGNGTLFRYDVHAGLSIAVEMRVTSWLSFAYHQDLPDDYTALPPK